MSVQQTVQPPEMLQLEWSIGGAGECGQAAELAAAAFDPHFREAWTEGQMTGLIVGGSSWLELARHRGRLLAFALCRQVVDEVELLLCAVSSDSRRQGIGSALVRQVSATARNRGANRLFLEVREGNSAALSLYRSTGFAASGRRPGYYRTSGGETIDAITLSLSF